MLTKLLEKFEDIFQPISDKERDERSIMWVVKFWPIKDGEYIFNTMRDPVVILKIKGLSFKECIYKATKSLVGSTKELKKEVDPECGEVVYSLLIHSSDKVTDDKGKQMIGLYGINCFRYNKYHHNY